MVWHNWVVRLNNPTTPMEWDQILGVLSATGLNSKSMNDIIDKIELASFVTKGDRRGRWTLDITDPEYCTEKEAIDVAKKLLWLALLSNNAPGIPQNLSPLLLCDATQGCKLFIGHDGPCNTVNAPAPTPTRCPMCHRIINYEDFDRDGRKDPLSIQIGHRTPLSRQVRQHNARNISWTHRQCNFIQGDQTLDEALRNLADILEAHGFTVTH